MKKQPKVTTSTKASTISTDQLKAMMRFECLHLEERISVAKLRTLNSKALKGLGKKRLVVCAKNVPKVVIIDWGEFLALQTSLKQIKEAVAAAEGFTVYAQWSKE